MKQRFSSLDVKVIAHELSETLVTLRLSNIYDLSSKILLLKFAKPDNKKQVLIDSGFRCHLTDFARTTASGPSAFVARLRKFLKTRRCTSVAQIGTDRIIEFQFSDGAYRLYLEFFAAGNVILTDADLKILALLRPVPEGEGQEPQRVGLRYSLENRQNYGGVPALTKERLRNALQITTDKAAAAATSGAETGGKKIKRKTGDDLRRGLATTLEELPPVVVDHAFDKTQFPSTSKPAEVLENEALFDELFASLGEARKIIDEVTSLSTTKGYVFAKTRPTKPEEAGDKRQDESESLLYEDFQPFVPLKYEKDTTLKILDFDNFNKTADEYFSSIEGQKLESRLTEREAAARKKLDAARRDQAKRVEGLQEHQMLNFRKAAAIEANVERVQEAMDSVNSLVAQGMDWGDIDRLIEREQQRGNPVAQIVKLPLNLARNLITLLLAEEDTAEDEDEADETDSEASDSDDETITSKKAKPVDNRLAIEVKLGLSPYANSREYYDQKRTAAVKEQKTLQHSAKALKSAEQKIADDLRKGLKQEKAILQPIRQQMWFEKFHWFVSSDGYLILGGRDAQQEEILYKRFLRKGDVYVHADIEGAAMVIIKNNVETPDAPIPPSTLNQAGNLTVCSSTAWDSKAGMGAWWVNAEQVSKEAASAGDYLPVGSFAIRGNKNYLAPAALLLGFGLMFRISDASRAHHGRHRIENTAAPKAIQDEQIEEKQRPESQESHRDSGIGSSIDDTEEVEDDVSDAGTEKAQLEHDADDGAGANIGASAQSTGDDVDATEPKMTDTTDREQEASSLTEGVEELGLHPAITNGAADAADAETETQPSDGETQYAESIFSSATATTQNKKAAQAKRGRRGKAKKLAVKYKDLDEEDRAAREALIGASVGRQRAEEEAKARAQKIAEQNLMMERRKFQKEQQRKQIAEHEVARQAKLAADLDGNEDDGIDAEKMDQVHSLVGTPAVGDEILDVIPICAPWTAMGKIKYKVKIQPGAVKKGKAVKDVIERWKIDATKKSVVDESSADREKMWPREVELIRGMKVEEAYNCVPVSKLKVMVSGGAGGGGSGGQGQTKKSGGGGGRGGKGSKRK